MDIVVQYYNELEDAILDHKSKVDQIQTEAKLINQINNVFSGAAQIKEEAEKRIAFLKSEIEQHKKDIVFYCDKIKDKFLNTEL